MADSILWVPVHLDALLLDSDRFVVSAMADFTRLPYPSASGDVNATVANLGEAITSKPFENENLYLKKGVHLHWALPDALTRADHSADGTDFPAVPNRWLVTRSRAASAGGPPTIEKAWIVESDYLFPEGLTQASESALLPVERSPSDVSQQPFRALGRAMPLADWKPSDPSAQYLSKLTAVGYGEPTFAAFYPNCHSVFGFHDDEPGELIGTQYDVVGWYGNSAQDPLRAQVDAFVQAHPQARPEELRQAVEDALGWAVPLAQGQTFPRATVCFARLTLQEKGALVLDPSTTVTVANTGTEALSAWLARTLGGDGADTLEDQLEALLLASRLQSRQLDLGPRLQEARHEKGFSSAQSGSLWLIRPEPPPGTAADASTAQQITLPDPLAEELNTLNVLQQAYDQEHDELESLRRQLFSDWARYMVCAYPPEDTRDEHLPADEVRRFIETCDLGPLDRKIRNVGTLSLQRDAAGRITAASSPASASPTVASLLAAGIQRTLDAVAAHNAASSAQGGTAALVLQQLPGPRYYQPTEPVVLLNGEAVKPTSRYGQDGRLTTDGTLECKVLPASLLTDLSPASIPALLSAISGLRDTNSGEQIGFFGWTQQPWNPILLEWEVELFPVSRGDSAFEAIAPYTPDYITGNYTLGINEVELKPRPGRAGTARGANVYTGTSILTPYTRLRQLDALAAYLTDQVLDDYRQAQGMSPTDPVDLDARIGAIQAWYESTHASGLATPEARNADPAYTAIRAYRTLLGQRFLSQSLSGFNEALLMHRQALQLPIADPLCFDDERAFTDSVRDRVQGSNRSAPLPENDFNPIRAGTLLVRRLRLVDSFGQTLDLKYDELTTPAAMRVPGRTELVALAPRLVQPARLSLRWLSAEDDDVESNAHPATSPICGWLIPNNLDQSLMLYDALGVSLGAITLNRESPWQSAPGGPPSASIDDIQNRHLQRLARFLVNQQVASLASGERPTFLEQFIGVVDSALENIDPEGFAQHQDLALLLGRPMALVRASVNLELQGLPAADQGWDALFLDLQRGRRETGDFTGVEFPIRIGEYRQLNDGVVGYWKDADEDSAADIFYAPQGEPAPSAAIKTQAGGPLEFLQSIDSPPQLLTLLVDPRGSVHATSGVLPTKSITLPPDQYASALKRLEVTFLTAPLLTRQDRVDAPVPSEPGYAWAWVERRGGDFNGLTPQFETNETEATFSGPQVAREGWLKLWNTEGNS